MLRLLRVFIAAASPPPSFVASLLRHPRARPPSQPKQKTHPRARPYAPPSSPPLSKLPILATSPPLHIQGPECIPQPLFSSRFLSKQATHRPWSCPALPSRVPARPHVRCAPGAPWPPPGSFRSTWRLWASPALAREDCCAGRAAGRQDFRRKDGKNKGKTWDAPRAGAWARGRGPACSPGRRTIARKAGGTRGGRAAEGVSEVGLASSTGRDPWINDLGPSLCRRRGWDLDKDGREVDRLLLSL